MRELEALQELIAAGGVVVLSGAGISTDSGIPDYRGPSGALRARLPMTIRDFTGSPEARQRYWARSQVGWRRMRAAEPNANHRAVSALEAQGLITGTITQNVDGLHQKGGARNVIELHGSLDRVVCLDCGAVSSREHLDDRLRELNGDPGFDALAAQAESNPDGDVELPSAYELNFTLAHCESCGSDLLKPDVVFFGENVPKPRVATCFDWVTHATSLLVLGSSLTVMSGLRFVKRAHAEGIPVAIVNHGVTRGDPEASVRVDAPLATVLPGLARAQVTPGVGAGPTGRR